MNGISWAASLPTSTPRCRSTTGRRPPSPVPDVGATVIATTNDDPALARRIADDVSDYMWRERVAFAHRR